MRLPGRPTPSVVTNCVSYAEGLLDQPSGSRPLSGSVAAQAVSAPRGVP